MNCSRMKKNRLLILSFSLALAALSLFFSSCTDQGAWEAIEDQFALVRVGRIWLYRRPVTLDASGIGEDLIDAPVLVHLTPSRIDYDKADANRRELRFYLPDGRTELAHEVELWNPAGDSYIWVKVPHIEAGTNRIAFYLYYGNRAPQAPRPSEEVWSNGYVAVWHLGEAQAPYRDSSPNRLIGTVGTVPLGNSLSAPASSAGFIGQGLHYLSISDGFFVYPSDAISMTAPLSLMMWVNILD